MKAPFAAAGAMFGYHPFDEAAIEIVAFPDGRIQQPLDAGFAEAGSEPLSDRCAEAAFFWAAKPRNGFDVRSNRLLLEQVANLIESRRL